MARPIVFTQLRPGKDGRLFKFYKFRTMTDD
ncbi:sugar transferase [Moorena sp. SIO4G3]|nr:sugar transferase [Moorena sp. SIO4G3]